MRYRLSERGGQQRKFEKVYKIEINIVDLEVLGFIEGMFLLGNIIMMSWKFEIVF